VSVAAEVRGASGARVAAQAKINLRLRILAREATGFHQLETLFLRLTLADTVCVRRTTGTRSLDITGLSDASAIGPAERNLAWRAAEAYLDAVRWPGGFAIELEKRIPIGGGLGGGSADAGAVLRALDALAPTPLGEAALLRLAAALGADVPFLTAEHPYALGWGRGERLLALPAPPAREVALLVPSFSVNTAAAYGWLAESRAAAGGATMAAGVLDLGALSRWEELAPLARNDFEPVVAAHRPEIALLVAALREAGCSPAMMSGSGSVVFGVRGADAEKHLPALPRAAATLLTSTATRVEPVVPLD
jgi:4-diphosphocytidyl-2-C-methyl-D-erythritol kinase